MQPILCENELFYGKVCEAIMYSPFKVPEAIRISNMYSLFCVHHPHDYTFEGEVHDFWECLFVVSGELRVVGDERVYILKENDFIIHKPLELHKFTVLSESGAEVFIFSFDAVGALLKVLCGNAFHMDDDAAEIVRKIINFACKAHSTPSDSYGIRTLFRLTSDAVFSQTVLSHIYLLLLSVYGADILTPVSNSHSTVLFGDAVMCMTNNIKKNLSVSDIARLCGASPTSLQNVFAEYSGLSVHKYFIRLKINTAMQYLNKGMSVTASADALGFSSQAHFTKVFKKETGLSPRSYKETVAGAKGSH